MTASVLFAVQQLIEGHEVPLRFDDGELTGATVKCRTATVDVMARGTPLLIDMPLGERIVARLTKAR